MSWTPTDEQMGAARDAAEEALANACPADNARVLTALADGDDTPPECTCPGASDIDTIARAVLVAVGPMIAAGAFRDFAVEKRAEWAPHACPWVGALDDRATQIEKEAGR